MILYGTKHKRALLRDGKYIGATNEIQRKQIEALYRAGRVESLKHALTGFELEDFQTVLPAIAFMSKRFLIGADTGLGKSLMMALYLKIHAEKGKLGKGDKALIVTTNSSLNQIKKVIESSTGMRVKHLPGDANKLMEVLQNKDLHEYDVYIVANSNFGKSIEFSRVFAYLISSINIFILDESMSVANKDSLTHQAIGNWIKNCEYRLFLNATVIEKRIEQLYYQFHLLEPDLLPRLDIMKKNHEVWSKKGKQSRAQLSGYKNVDKLLDSMPYHYSNISRVDLGRTFEYEDILLPLMATPKQKLVETPQNYVYALFSPTTQAETKVVPFTPYDVPALGKTIEVVEKEFRTTGGGIVIYAEPTACKDVIERHLIEKMPDIRIGIIDGQSVDKDYTRDGFNNGQIDLLIINIPEALDLVVGRVMIFYTIPSKHYQARARIARGLTTNNAPKKYYYPVYLNTFQSRYIQTTLKMDEETLDNSLKRGITTARDLTKKIQKLEGNIVAGVMF